MRSLIFALALAAQAQPSVRAGPADAAARQVLERWEAGAELIESYDLSLELTSKLLIDDRGGKPRLLAEADAIRFPPPSFSRIYRAAGKRRGDFARDTHGHHAPPTIWDGTTGYSFQPGSAGVVVESFVLTFGSMEYEDYESTYRTFMGTTDRIALSKERNSRLLPREGSLYVVDVPRSRSGDVSTIRWRVWLDPDRNFMPVKIAQWYFTKGVDAHGLDIENDLREVAHGVWAPVRSTFRNYYKDKNSPLYGKNVAIYELRVIDGPSTFNSKIDSSLFEVVIPNGMTVIDRRRNAVYTQGSKNADEYLALLARDEKKRLNGLPGAERMPPSAVFVPPDPTSRWLWPLLGGTGAILAAGTLHILRRRWTLRGG